MKIESDLNEIKKKLLAQKEAMNEFESYLGILLKILQGSPKFEYDLNIKKVY